MIRRLSAGKEAAATEAEYDVWLDEVLDRCRIPEPDDPSADMAGHARDLGSWLVAEAPPHIKLRQMEAFQRHLVEQGAPDLGLAGVTEEQSAGWFAFIGGEV